MARYVYRDGRLVDRVTHVPLLRGDEPLARPSVMSDIGAYASPLQDGWIEGRAARREHLKKHNCREVDPSEFRPSYQSKDERAARVAAQQRTLNDRT